MFGLIGRMALTGVVAGALTLGASGATDAATVTNGSHGKPEASCDLRVDPTVTVHAPYMEASVATYPANVFVVGGNHTQWVGYRAWLLRWNPVTRVWGYTDQNRDGQFDHGALYQAQVSNGAGYLAPSQWLNADAKRWEVGSTSLPIRDAGYYRVRVEYTWYADSYTGSGYDVQDSDNHYVLNGLFVIAKPWCQY